MALNIIKAEQELKPENLTIMIYGQPGAGKTSFSFTSESPILVDFDKLAYKAGNRKDIVKVSTWEEVRNITPEDLVGYETIIVDTVGKAQEFVIDYLVRKNPKFKTSVGYSMQMYGLLISEFVDWFKRINSFGKDVILIAHDKDLEEDGVIKKRPEIVGKTFSKMIAAVDMLGYIYIEDKHRIITFSNNEKIYSKNVGNPPIEDIVFGNFLENPNYFKELKSKFMERIGNVSEETKALTLELKNITKALSNCNNEEELDLYVDSMEKPSSKINVLVNEFILNRRNELFLEDLESKLIPCDNVDDLNSCFTNIGKPNPKIRTEIWELFKNKGENLNSTFDKKDGIFKVNPTKQKVNDSEFSDEEIAEIEAMEMADA